MSNTTDNTQETGVDTAMPSEDAVLEQMREIQDETGLPIDFLENMVSALPLDTRMAALECMKRADPKWITRVRLHHARLFDGTAVPIQVNSVRGAA